MFLVPFKETPKIIKEIPEKNKMKVKNQVSAAIQLGCKIVGTVTSWV